MWGPETGRLTGLWQGQGRSRHGAGEEGGGSVTKPGIERVLRKQGNGRSVCREKTLRKCKKRREEKGTELGKPY